MNNGLREVRLDIAVEEYVKEKASLEQSSEIAGVSLWKFLDELRRRNVAMKYTIADAESEISKALARKR